MKPSLDPAVVAVTGSEARAWVLAVLANSSEPLTGYRIAQIASLQRTKTNRILERAEAAGVIARIDGKEYVLTDGALGEWLRQRVRIRWSEEWDRARAGWNPATTRAILRSNLRSIKDRIRVDPNYLRPRGWAPPNATKAVRKELNRPARKDELLRRSGLRTSERKDWMR